MTNASNCKWGFTHDSNPKRGNTKKGNLKDINLFKSAKAKKNRVIAYLIVFSEYGTANTSIASVTLPLSATPNMVKGVTKLVYIYVKEPRLKSLTWRT